jgi:hypothetical protein
MKRFNRKKLIPSLAASVMVAAATFAPLSGFLAAGSVVHADPAFPAPFTEKGSHHAHSFSFLRVENPGRLNRGAAIVVELEYKCFLIPNASNNSNLGNIIVTITQGTAQQGTPPQGAAMGTGNNDTNIICDGQEREAGVTVPPMDQKFFDVGRACVTATLTSKNSTEIVLAGPITRDINVEV